MRLYYAETISARKACVVAKYLESPVELVHVDLGRGEQRTDAFASINPNRKIPVLVEERHSLWESNAIMARLARLASSSLWPDDERVFEVVKWLSWDAAHFTRFAGELYFQHLVRPFLGLGAPDKDAVQNAQSAFRQSATVLDGVLADRTWAAGESLTIADFALGASVPWAHEASIPLGEFPNVARWARQLGELDAWRDPFPARA
jgi:glutathione S-transferase